MKKLYILLLFLLCFSQIYAGNILFNLERSQRFSENEGEIYLSPLIIDLGETGTNKLDFYISNNDYFIFGNDISNIFTNRTDIKFKTKISSGNKLLSLNFDNTFTGAIKISNILIRTYNERISGAKIGLDYNNDGIIDSYSQNVIDLDKDNRYSDNMKPLPVSDVKYNLSNSGNTINLTWNSSVDLDLNSTLVTMKKNNEYGNFYEKSVYKNENQELSYTGLDLLNNTYEINIYSKDNYYLTNEPFVLKLDKTNLVNLPTSSTGSAIIETQTGTITNTGEVFREKEIEKLIPVFKNKSYADFMIRFDNMIDKKGYNEEIRIIRNNVIKIIKNYEDKKIFKSYAISELKRLALELKQKFYKI